MFSLTVLDHIRLDSEHVARNYSVHARAADRFATLGFAARIVIVATFAVATAFATANLLVAGRFYQIAATVAAAVATLGFALYCVLGFETRVAAHRALSHRLWLIAERYRSLLAEADEGLVDRETLLARRDHLIEQLHAVYERGFGVEQRAYEAARLPAIPDDRAA